MKNVFDTAQGRATIHETDDGKRIIIKFDDNTFIELDHAAASNLNTAPHVIPRPPYPAKAAQFLDDLRDLCAMEIDYTEEQQAIIKTVWRFFGITETDATRRRTRPIEWSREGMRKRFARPGR